MNQKHLNRKKLIFCAEIAVLLILIAAMAYKTSHRKSYQFDLSEMYSDTMELSLESDKIHIESEEESEDGVVALRTAGLDLPAGSYTLSVDYMADSSQALQLSADFGGNFLHANEFYWSKNKHQVTYDFYATQKLDGLRFNLVDYRSGEVYIFNVNIYENSHNLKILAFLWVILSLAVNDIVFSPNYQKHRKQILWLVAMALFVSLPIFMKGLALGHDWRFHLARIESIATGIKALHLPVKMDTFFNDGYGYPVGIFYGDALLYVPALLRILGFSVMTSYKLYILMINVLTAISTFWCGKKIFKKEQSAYLFTFAYLTASYRLVDIFIRSAVGEYTAFLFFPIIAAGLWEMYLDENVSPKKNALTMAIGFAGLLYTHILSVEIAFVMVVIVALLLAKKTFRTKTLKTIGLSLLYTTGLGVAFAVPFVDYYQNADTYIRNTVDEAAMSIQKYGAYISDYFAFFKTFFGGKSDLVTQRSQFTPGIILMAALLLACYLIVAKKADKIIKFLTLTSLISLWMSSNLFPWDWLEKNTTVGGFLSQVQFPYRYIGLAMVVLALLLGYLYDCYGDHMPVSAKGMKNGIVICGMLTMCLFVSNFEDNADQQYIQDEAELPRYTCGFEDEPLALGATEYVIPDTVVEVLDYDIHSENAAAYLLSENDTDLVIAVETEGNAFVEIPRQNYPYYVANGDDDRQFAITRGENNKIRILLPDAFEGQIEIRFTEPWYWRVAELISLVCWGIAVGRCVKRNGNLGNLIKGK